VGRAPTFKQEGQQDCGSRARKHIRYVHYFSWNETPDTFGLTDGRKGPGFDLGLGLAVGLERIRNS